MKIKTIISLGLIVLLFSACYKNSLEELQNQGGCDIANVTYAKVIRPIINIHCNISGCHHSLTDETFALVTYEELKTVVDNGLLLNSINHNPGAVAMPKNVSKLSDCTIRQITSWINAGAKNN